jgi:hypothetical protein
MTIETTVVKRGALYVGEVGFFPSNQMAADDIAPAKMGGEVVCSFYSPRNLESLKFLWALVHKTADNSPRWLDKDEAMEDLKMRARFARFVVGADGKVELRPKSLKRISDEALRLLTDKIMDIICQEILPGMKRNDLRKEIELMLTGKQNQGGSLRGDRG